MTRPAGPRRAAASAGIAVALAAGATCGIVAADLEHALPSGPATVLVGAPATPETRQPGAETATPHTFTPAPTAPQAPRAGQVPHTTTRAS